MSANLTTENMLVHFVSDSIWRNARRKIEKFIHDYYCRNHELPDLGEVWHEKLFLLESETKVSLADIVCVYEKFDDEKFADQIGDKLNARIVKMLDEMEAKRCGSLFVIG